MKKIISIIIIVISINSIFGVFEFSNNVLSLEYENLEDELGISWEKHVIDNTFDYVFGVQAVDIDTDGDYDIIGAAQEGDFIAWWRNDGGNPIKWTKLIIDDYFDGATSVFAVDIDGDLDVDVVGSAWQANEIALWINNGDEQIGWTKYVIKSGFNFAHEVYCYDLDEDGDVDILGTSSEDNQIAWWKNNGGDPIGWSEQVIGNDFAGAKSVRVADIDNDGLFDVIGTAFYDNDIIWWRNGGGEPIVWEENTITDDFKGAHRAEVCDMDFDGDIDIVGAAYFDEEISWWRNDGGNPITWTKQVVASGFNGACIGLPIDIDRDRDIDIVGTAQRDYEVAIFRNDGNNPIKWTKIIVDPLFQGAWPGYVADIDGDRDIDILAGASWEDTLAWWESDLNPEQPSPPAIEGPSEGKPDIEYTFNFTLSDSEHDELELYVDWGDNKNTGWIGSYKPSEVIVLVHKWIDKDTYYIQAKVRDTYDDSESTLSTHGISMSKSKVIISPILRFLENHPNLFPILQRLLEI